jgi:hypothetical protein
LTPVPIMLNRRATPSLPLRPKRSARLRNRPKRSN